MTIHGYRSLSLLVYVGHRLALACALLTAAACTTLTPPAVHDGDNVVEALREAAAPQWWYVRFRLQRPADDEVNSYLDALIADRVLSDVIAQHRAGIRLWRFHRRWAPDDAGHQFSFIFFASPLRAARLTAEIERQPLLQTLRNDGHLLEFRVDEPDPQRAADPAATSDLSWPPAIQREWPKFIMGASRMWLGLVRDEAAKHTDLTLYARYQAVEAALDELWLKEANHAFFHHLSALFGYKPVRIIHRDVMTF
jgi:hypothetical protein